MNLATTVPARSLVAGCVLDLALTAAQAHPLVNLPSAGQGKPPTFDAAGGSGRWDGEIRAITDPDGATPLSLAAPVSFDDAAAVDRLRGRFEFTHADDRASSNCGRVRGGIGDAAGGLGPGGKRDLDHDVRCGAGRFGGTSGYAPSFLTFEPLADGGDTAPSNGCSSPSPDTVMA